MKSACRSLIKILCKLQTDEISRLNGIYKRMLSNAGVKLYEGEGKVAGPNEVEVTQLDGTKLSYSAKHILIATGSRAQRLNIPGQVNLHVLILFCKYFLPTSQLPLQVLSLSQLWYCHMYLLHITSSVKLLAACCLSV